jgi:hypothetical protein
MLPKKLDSESVLPKESRLSGRRSQGSKKKFVPFCVSENLHETI